MPWCPEGQGARASVRSGGHPMSSARYSFFPTAYNPSKHLAYGAGIDGCAQLKVDETRMGGPFWNGGILTRNKRMGGQIAAIDMTTGKAKAATQLDYPNYRHDRWHVHCVRRPGAETAVELQRRHSDYCSADQLFGRRQAVHRRSRRWRQPMEHRSAEGRARASEPRGRFIALRVLVGLTAQAGRRTRNWRRLRRF
jgi:hypothetical protein